MTQPPRRRSVGSRAAESGPDPKHPTWVPPGRACPWCGSRDTELVPRGLAGGQESRDQYIRCHDCGRITYDIVARSDREMRIVGLRQGGVFRDAEYQTRYTIYRVLKAGFNEFLLYVRPILTEDQDQQPS